MAEQINYNALGQAIDTTWGRSSTPLTSGYSVKFSLFGETGMIASYTAIVNFGTEKQMIDMKLRYQDEANRVVSEYVKAIKERYKSLTGKAIKIVENNSSDSIEVIGFGVHNPRRTAYYRKKLVFELG